ncbi:MAG: IS1595 family transposase [Acidobacteria bacterium]|nr:IS1595 family transposase [Acidobacteriota bacterium]
MQQLNRYYKRSKISERKFRQLLRHLSMTSILLKIRKRLAEECERASPFSSYEVEVDESYFGPRRVRGKRGHDASGKTIVFGIFKRNGSVYTEIVPDCKKATLQAIIRGRVTPEAIINSDGWRGYDGLVDVGYSKHFRVNHGQSEFVRGTHHVNGIESFWSYAKRRLQKFNGVSHQTFNLHLKECEYRFNYRNKDLSSLLLKLLERYPL